MKSPIHFFIIIVSTSLLWCNYSPKPHHIVDQQVLEKVERKSVDIQKTRLKAKEAFIFCKSMDFNTDFCILIDMSIHSGLNRFFVWDFNRDTISHSTLVGHGCCDYPWSVDSSKANPTFSNVEGSHCSSLGKYEIGAREHSIWGINIKYVLHGLEATNDNAFSRFIVLHSYEKVKDEEVFPNGTPEGWGCPIISNNNMRVMDEKLENAEKTVLMWIYK